MKSSLVFILLFTIIGDFTYTSFKEQQLRYPRVRQAYADKEVSVKKLLNEKSLKSEKLSIYIRAFKEEQKIELWGKNESQEIYKLIKEYEVCQTSGVLGPKRKEGDRQIPEGYYHINIFNPSSNFYLSLGVNYPNKSDRILGVENKLGGDIFIHGSCVTIGCLPITDDQIKELYIFCVEAKNSGQTTIPVTIFPKRLTLGNYQSLVTQYKSERDKLNLWEDLKLGYDYFQENKKLPHIQFLSNGRHRISG
ncbi:MAG: L,D-transpeptidase family protein [Bacteroidota bacterium]